MDYDPRMLRFLRDALAQVGYAPLASDAPSELSRIVGRDRVPKTTTCPRFIRNAVRRGKGRATRRNSSIPCSIRWTRAGACHRAESALNQPHVPYRPRLGLLTGTCGS